MGCGSTRRRRIRRRSFLPSAIVLLTTPGFAPAAQPVYAVVERGDVKVVAVNAKSKTIKVEEKGGSLVLSVGPKTWIIANEKEAAFADLKVGQRLRVLMIP